MPFPVFDFCIMCEGIRPEVGGKLTILGFYGLAPNVEVAIANPAQPLSLAFIAGFPPVADATRTVYEHAIVITRPDQAVVQQTPRNRLNVSPTGRGLVIFGFVIPPPYFFGAYSIRISVNGEVKLDTMFRLRAATQTELAGLGIFPAPTARPN